MKKITFGTVACACLDASRLADARRSEQNQIAAAMNRVKCRSRKLADHTACTRYVLDPRRAFRFACMRRYLLLFQGVKAQTAEEQTAAGAELSELEYDEDEEYTEALEDIADEMNYDTDDTEDTEE